MLSELWDDEELRSEEEDLSERVQSGGNEDKESDEAEVVGSSGEEESGQNMESDEQDDEAEKVEELRKTREADRKKGRAVKRQLATWDSLLDARIRMQKAVIAANRLPLNSERSKFKTSIECETSLKKMLCEAIALSDELMELQEILLTTNEIIKPPPRKRRKCNDDEDWKEYESCLREATESASCLENSFHPYLIQTLAKWSQKIQAVAPSVLLPSNRNAFSSKSSQHLKSAVQLVDEVLLDNEKLLSRTRIRRGKDLRIGSRSVDNTDGEAQIDDEKEDVEVFDDTDFYQQLLRDVIDSRGGGIGGNDDWLALQKQKKAKKKVDTKASKGRKIRYEVHEKMQNFMVPVPVIGGWHEDQIDELFASILGGGFEDLIPVERAAEKRAIDDQISEVLKDGFRVFG